MRPKIEHVISELDSSIHAFYYKNECFDAPWHYHSEYELTYIIKSSGIRYMGNAIDDFYPGDIVLIGPQLPHCWKNNPDYKEGSESICIQWKHEALNQLISESVELASIQSLFDRAEKGVKIEIPDMAAIECDFRSIPEMEPGKRLTAFIDLLLTLSRAETQVSLSDVRHHFLLDKQSDHRVNDILLFIDENYSRKITIKDMAEITYLTEVSFCKFFKKRFSKSFTNYLNEYRARKICQQLRETDHTLVEIAMSCGYENMSFFHRQFKKYLHMNPKEYRQQWY